MTKVPPWHNKAAFLQHFMLQQAPIRQRPALKRLRPAAVLLPLVERDYGLGLILTQRAANLRHHAGQISFPGGRYEAADGDLRQTALRETEEEIGLAQHNVEIIGQLQDYPVISNYLIRPFVGFVNVDEPLQRQRSEVAEIFEVPLAQVLHQPDHYVFRLRRFIYPEVYFIAYQQRQIWGATAGILRELADHLAPEHQQLFRPLN